MVIAGCTRRKRVTAASMPAIELYEGGCVPALRARIGCRADLAGRVFFLSARHGLIRADTPLQTYDQRLTRERAAELHPGVSEAVERAVGDLAPVEEMLLLVEPDYLVPLAGLLAWPRRPVLHWFPDPGHAWAAAGTVLDRWGWR
jgi:hypothetical protein